MAIARAATVVRPQAGTATRRHERGPAAGAPTEHAVVEPAAHIRRCTFRRVTARPHGRRELPLYDVECLHPSYATALPLGDLVEAHAACGDCALPGIFRPDED
jgi:hypothetical protein